MTTNEVIESISKMTDADLDLVAESVSSRRAALLKLVMVRRSDDLRSGRVKGLTHGEVFEPLMKKYGGRDGRH
jgi:hypothetical protein